MNQLLKYSVCAVTTLLLILMVDVTSAQGNSQGRSNANGRKEDKKEHPGKDKEEKGAKEKKENAGKPEKEKDKEHEEKEKEKKEKEEDRDNKPEERESEGKEKDYPGQGHAYGRDKGDLSGREFGQQRAAEARGKAKENLDTSRVKLSVAEAKVQTSLQKLDSVRTKLETDFKTGKIKTDVYTVAKEKIALAEQKLRSIEQEAIRVKQQVEKAASTILTPKQ